MTYRTQLLRHACIYFVNLAQCGKLNSVGYAQFVGGDWRKMMSCHSQEKTDSTKVCRKAFS